MTEDNSERVEKASAELLHHLAGRQPDLDRILQLRAEGAVLPESGIGFERAAMLNQPFRVRAFIEAGCDLKTDHAGSAFHWVARYGHADLVRTFIAGGVDLEYRGDCGNTLLMYAVQTNNIDLAKIMIEAGADMNTANMRNESPLQWSAWMGQEEMTRILIAAKAEVNRCVKGKPALLWAVETQFKTTNAVVSLLTEAGAGLDVQDENGHTALHLAIKKSNDDLRDQLVRAGARFDIKDARGYTALDMLRPSAFSAYKDLDIYWLTQREYKDLALAFALSGTAARQQACLFHAVRQPVVWLLKRMIEADVPLDCRDDLGCGLLHRAVLGNQPGIVTVLLEAGAPVQMRLPGGATALDLARHTPEKSSIAELEKAMTEYVDAQCAAGLPIQKSIRLPMQPRMKR